ncbi:MAG: amino acid synthesis family protein [Rhodospirillales bacterium]
MRCSASARPGCPRRPSDRDPGYGKAAIVGEDGELEHAAAILHPLSRRTAAQGGRRRARRWCRRRRARRPRHADRRAARPGVAAFVRSHFDAMEVRIADAPRRDEIVVAVVVTDTGRPLPRVGGLLKEQIKGEDGLR